jgi:hypothetical protein
MKIRLLYYTSKTLNEDVSMNGRSSREKKKKLVQTHSNAIQNKKRKEE